MGERRADEKKGTEPRPTDDGVRQRTSGDR
jgi:hypothetical protein